MNNLLCLLLLNEKTVTLVVTEDGRETLVSRPAGTHGPDADKTYIAVNTKNVTWLDGFSPLEQVLVHLVSDLAPVALAS